MIGYEKEAEAKMGSEGGDPVTLRPPAAASGPRILPGTTSSKEEAEGTTSCLPLPPRGP